MTRIFAVTVPGLESFTALELNRMGISISPPSPEAQNLSRDEYGGIELEGSLTDLYRLNLHLRTATRILVRLGEFFATGFPELRRKAAHLPWNNYLSPGQALSIRVTCHRSRLYHSGAVAERIAASISDCLGKPPIIQKLDETPDDAPSQLIIVRIVENKVNVSIDSSGQMLHRRGYRLETAKAPLRETLAAGMLLASGWDGTAPIIDPFCGSGTIPIEAALYTRHIAPGKNRPFAFMDWPNFENKKWAALLQEAAQNESHVDPLILATDRDAGAVQAAMANAERAGVKDSIQFNCQAVSALTPPSGLGWIITNPPYGVRVKSNHDLRDLYARLGQVLHASCSGWQVALLCADDQLLRQTRLDYTQGFWTTNGGIKVKLSIGKVQ